jgi:hypothetical protein
MWVMMILMMQQMPYTIEHAEQCFSRMPGELKILKKTFGQKVIYDRIT